MKFFVNFIITLTFLVHINCSTSVTQNHRKKRFLIFAPAAPSRVQFIAGFGIPADLEIESLTTGYVFKTIYFLPTSVNDLQWQWVVPDKIINPGQNILAANTILKKRRSLADNSTTDAATYPTSTEYIDPQTGEHIEKYDQTVEVIDVQSIDDHEDVEVDYSKDYEWRRKYLEDKSLRNEHSRWTLYKMLEGVLENENFNGNECLKRAICEAASIKFGHENGMLGELIHTILSPSATSEVYSQESDEEFDHAEELGKKQKPCEVHYSKCHVSLLDIFSKIM